MVATFKMVVEISLYPMSADNKIDWSQYSLVESKAKVLGGVPVLRGTRMPADAIADNFEYGMSITEIAEQFELASQEVEAIISYAQDHRIARPVSRKSSH